MRGPAVRPVVIAAGGTGGHFFPAEALGAELIRRGRRIALMTDARSGAVGSEVFGGHEHFVIRGAGIAGRGIQRATKASLALALGVVQARGILRRLNPAVLVAFGGYPSVGPVLGARLAGRVPVILHEQNAVLGRANRFLSRSATLLALSFDSTSLVPARVRCATIGNPVRPVIAALADTSYFPPDDTIRLLVIGGSLGARVFSDIVPAALAGLPDELRARLTVTQQCRAEDLERVDTAYSAAGIPAQLAAFFPNMSELLATAHLVIGRAGASTVAELAVAGRPAILVPLPGAIDDHQTENARALMAAGGAWIVPQRDFIPASLSELLISLLASPAMLTRAAGQARGVARTGAASRLADLVEQLMPQEARP